MANVKISALPAATTISAGDLLPVVQGGVTKQVTPDLLPLSAATAAALAGKDASGAAAAAQVAAIQRANHTGTQSADTITDGTTNKAFLATERTKLAGIATGATANRTDAAVDTLLTGKADLVAGVIPTAQIPALALNTAVTVASQAAMLALTAAQVQPGDVAVRTDGAGTFILTATDPTVLGNWTRLNAPTDAVTTVNGQTGTVVLSAANVGADAAGAAAAAVTGLAPLSSPAFTGSPTIGGATVAKTTDISSVIAPLPTGVAATDTANLQAAVNSVPAGGRLYLRRSAFGAAVHYMLNAALTIPASMTVEGDGISTVWGSDPNMPTGLTGTIIEQTAAGADGILITATKLSVNLRRFGILFTAGLASTGHGVNAAPTATAGSGHVSGLFDFLFENVTVHGHDGNHYGFRFLNPLYGTVTHCRSYGGGGYATICDPGEINAGNIVFTHPLAVIANTGTAAGYLHSGVTGTPGTLNFLTYIRPQVIIVSGATSAGTNPIWDDLAGTGIPKGITAVGADFETSGPSLFRPGAHTEFLASGLIQPANVTNTGFGDGALPNWTGSSNGSSNTAFGNGALNVNTSGGQNTAVGGAALLLNTTGANNTAVGNIALENNTVGANNTAVGFNALSSNTTGSNNVAIGREAVRAATTVDSLVGIGYRALASNTTGTNNLAIGNGAAASLTTGGGNTAFGNGTLGNIVTTYGSTAIGNLALYNFTGQNGTAIGSGAAQNTTSGNDNTAVGQAALYTNTTGAANVALGAGALNYATVGTGSTAVGYQAMQNATSGDENTVVGYQAGVTQTWQNSIVSSWGNTYVGYQSGPGSATQNNYATALGFRAVTSAPGAVAIGADSTGAGAAATIQDSIALGTATHKVQVKNNATGAASAALGANSPATVPTAPYTWFRMLSSDGTTVFLPAWK